MSREIWPFGYKDWESFCRVTCAFLSISIVLAISSCKKGGATLPYQDFEACYQTGVEAGRTGAVGEAELCENKEAFWAGYRHSELELIYRGKRQNAVPSPPQRLDYETERKKGETAYQNDDYDAWNKNQDNPWFKEGWHIAAEDAKAHREPTAKELGAKAFENGDYDALEANQGNTLFYKGWQRASDLVAAAEAKRLQEVTGKNYLFERNFPSYGSEGDLASSENTYESGDSTVRQPLSKRRMIELVEIALDRAQEEMERNNIPDTPKFESVRAEIQLKHIGRVAAAAGVDDDELMSVYLLDRFLKR
jgi:hypothetical protein